MEERSPFEGIDDPILRVQMEHEMRAIEELVFVTKLSFVPAHKDKAEGFRATLSCALCRWYDSCGKGQEQAVQLSRERTTLLACLQQLRKRLQDRHGFRCAQAVAKKAAADAQAPAAVHTPSVLEAMMLLQFTVLPFQGIEQRKKRVAEWVAKALPSVKPGVWGCVQARTQWSTEEDAHMRPGHHWLCEFGDAGNGTSCERQFNLDHRKCEDYRGTRFYNKDSALVIKR